MSVARGRLANRRSHFISFYFFFISLYFANVREQIYKKNTIVEPQTCRPSIISDLHAFTYNRSIINDTYQCDKFNDLYETDYV